MYVEDAGGSTGQPTPVRVKEVGTTTVACMHETKTILLLIHLVAPHEQVLDLKSVGFEDVVGRLKAYEERIRCDEGGDEQQRVMLTRVSGGDGSFTGGRYGAGSSNDVGGQRVMFTRSNGGCESSGDGRNTGGGSGGGFSSGFPDSSKREMKGKWRSINRCEVNNKEGFGGGSSSSSGGRRGGDFSGVSGSGDWSREMKGKWGKNNNRGEGFIRSGSGSSNGSGGSGLSSGSGSKSAQNNYKPNKSKPNNQPNCISEKQETIGSNQVQGNAELDRN